MKGHETVNCVSVASQGTQVYSKERRLHMSVEIIVILMLVAFILGLVVGIVLATPRIMHH